MELEHLFDLDLRYQGEYTVVRPYGGADGIGYATGTGRAIGERLQGAVRFSNNPRVRGDGILLAELAGDIETDDGARVVFTVRGLGRRDDRVFRLVGSATLESDDERYAWLNQTFCVVEATVRGRHVELHAYRCSSDA